MDSDAKSPAGECAFELVFNEAVFLENLDRQRRVSKWRWVLTVVRVVFGGGLGLLAVLAIRDGNFGVALFFGCLVLLLLSSRSIDRWMVLRNFRRSPYQNERLLIRLTDDQVEVKGSISDVSQRWEAFTGAVGFEDGLLLFQGPGIAKWLPFSAMTKGTPTEAMELVAVKVSNLRRM